MKNVLLVDGPEAGIWVKVPDNYTSWKVPQMTPISWMGMVSSEEEYPVAIPYTDYQLLEVPLSIFGAGGKVYVGFSQKVTEAGKSIIEALFQRDVAKELLKL